VPAGAQTIVNELVGEAPGQSASGAVMMTSQIPSVTADHPGLEFADDAFRLLAVARHRGPQPVTISPS
jgi:hypothetical protein